MTVQMLLLWGAAALFVVLGVAGYLLVIASSRASHTAARVRALLREARAGDDPHEVRG
jgi:hypothetical protein